MWSLFKPNVNRLQAKQNIDKLISLLNYSDLNIVSAAATALGELEADDAVNPLTELLQIHGGDIGERSIEALENIGTNNAVNALIVVCETVGTELCVDAIKALGRLKNFNCAEFLMENLSSNSSDVAIESANSLGLIGDKIAINHLLEAGKSEHPELATACQKALHKIGYSTDSNNSPDTVTQDSAPPIASEIETGNSANLDNETEIQPVSDLETANAPNTEAEPQEPVVHDSSTSEAVDIEPDPEIKTETVDATEVDSKVVDTEEAETEIAESLEPQPDLKVDVDEPKVSEPEAEMPTELDSEVDDNEPQLVAEPVDNTEAPASEPEPDQEISSKPESSEVPDEDPLPIEVHELDVGPKAEVEIEPEPEPSSDGVTILVPSKFRELIHAKGDLPSLPDVVRKVSEKMKDPNCSLEDIANLIGADPMLTSRIIKVANSSRYGSGKAVSSFTTAMVRLGFKEIQNIIYSYALLKTFKSAKLINKKKFWLHSLAVGFCAQTLSILLGATDEEQDHAYMSGLMHDVGIMVFGYLIPDSYRDFLKRIVGDHHSDTLFKLQNEEKTAFQIDHSAIGAAYIKHWWPVDDEVVICARDHHKGLDNDQLTATTRVVIIANMFCNSIKLNNGVNIQVTPTPIELSHFEDIGLNRKGLKDFVELAKLDIETAKSILTK